MAGNGEKTTAMEEKSSAQTVRDGQIAPPLVSFEKGQSMTLLYTI